MSSRCPERAALLLALVVAAGAGCAREKRQARPPAELAGLAGGAWPVNPDQSVTGGVSLAIEKAAPPTGPIDPYTGIAYELSEGKRLFFSYNCNGCHAQGGGGIGPALTDAATRYGSRPQDLYSTLVHGRPNGMPAFRGKMSDAHVWRLVAYVRSLAGIGPRAAAPARSDHMATKSAENAVDPQMSPATTEARP
jgi:cytochrome c oxidase cbb3-type subunit 3